MLLAHALITVGKGIMVTIVIDYERDNYVETFGESNMSKNTIKVIKGTKTTKDTINKVINFIKKIDAKSPINISSEITCLDIPENSVQIIWANGTESFLGGNYE